MSYERPDIPVLTVSWINHRLREMAADQTANEIDGEIYLDRKGHFFSACWQFCRDSLSDLYDSVLKR
ncbi:MAG: hypothetical protein CMJ46_08575 [Planctomyces sp.]|nr:hypothetical protein [Planctomyces sp.]